MSMELIRGVHLNKSNSYISIVYLTLVNIYTHKLVTTCLRWVNWNSLCFTKVNLELSVVYAFSVIGHDRQIA